MPDNHKNMFRRAWAARTSNAFRLCSLQLRAYAAQVSLSIMEMDPALCRCHLEHGGDAFTSLHVPAGA